MYQEIIAVGDCNTLGTKTFESNSYPEILGTLLNAKVTNLGHTMATSREGIRLLHDRLKEGDSVIVIQFGLVDSYQTFKYSPYVLYYPDNILRKQLRSLTKKFKKICRNIGLNKKLGEINVVPIEEYESNIRKMIEIALPRTILLLDTIPNKQEYRNSEIQRYNKCLDKICRDFPQCIKVDLYAKFHQCYDNYYMDETHANEAGYRYIAGEIEKKLKEFSK